jgi:hypothetical protein
MCNVMCKFEGKTCFLNVKINGILLYVFNPSDTSDIPVYIPTGFILKHFSFCQHSARVFISVVQGKGKFRPRTDHEGPKDE